MTELPEKLYLERWPEETDREDAIHYEQTGYGVDMRTGATSEITVYVKESALAAEPHDPERQARERLVKTARSVAKYHEEHERYGGASRDFHAIAHTFCLDVAALLDRAEGKGDG